MSLLKIEKKVQEGGGIRIDGTYLERILNVG